MPSNSTLLKLEYLWSELAQAGIFLERSAVQWQVLTLTIACLLSWLISRWIWTVCTRRSPQLQNLEQKQSKLDQHYYAAACLRHLLAPTLSLLVVLWLKMQFDAWGWRSGYLSDGVTILGYFCLYRCFLLSLYCFFPSRTVSDYRSRFFSPLFLIWVISNILSLFLDLNEVGQILIITLFGAPITLKAVFLAIAGLYFWIVGTSLLEKILIYVLSNKSSQDPRITQVIALLMRYFLIGFGVVLIFGYIGFNATAFAAISGGLSVGIGFGLKEVISNFVSGIFLLFEGVLKPGDIIMLSGKKSRVTRLGIRATTVRVIQDNSEEIIPNQTFFTQSVSTLTGSDNLLYHSLHVGASYQCNPAKVIKILIQVANQHPNILKEPSPKVFAIEFGDSSINFELKFWLSDPLLDKSVMSELITDIWQAFADNDIEIPYPQRDLHIRSYNTPSLKPN